MIHIGLTGWGDHPDIYSPTSTAKYKLKDYTAHFPVVELDATFYAVQPERNIRKWIDETPKAFQFIVKAYQGITGHAREKLPYKTKEEMYSQFEQSLQPLVEAHKMAMLLVQFPPWFDCTRAHVNEIRMICKRLKQFDIAIEFRHQSWYAPQFRSKTIAFLRDLNVIHSVCDEPQAGDGSIPLVPISTRSDKVLFRLHGRNFHGWRNVTGDAKAWRKVRYLYNYNDVELQQIEAAVKTLKKDTEHIFVIFNNNSGKHAAQNAKQFQSQLNITYENLAPKQLGLFEDW